MKKALKFILTAGIILIIALLIIAFRFGLFHVGPGGGDGTGTGSSASEGVPSQPSPADEKKVSEIRIDGNDIFFDDNPCANVDELKQQIIDIGTEHEYTFIYDNAIKGTYDEVRAMLSDLEDALGITINDK